VDSSVDNPYLGEATSSPFPTLVSQADPNGLARSFPSTREGHKIYSLVCPNEHTNLLDASVLKHTASAPE